MFLKLFLILIVLVGQVGWTQETWRADDDSFDPTVTSVVIENNSWLGDPSPFHLGDTTRRGYTHVQAVNYAGMEPSVQLSLIVPQTENSPVATEGAMLLLNEAQTAELIAHWKKMILGSSTAESSAKFKITTTSPGMEWELSCKPAAAPSEIRLVQIQKQGNQDFVFGLNAAKKLLGALEHSHQRLQSLQKSKTNTKGG